MLKIVHAAVRQWGRLWKSSSYSQRLFPVVLSPVDSQTEYAWFPWGERDPFFPPKEPRGVGPPQNPHITSTRSPDLKILCTSSPPPRGSAELFCSFQRRKCWPAAWGCVSSLRCAFGRWRSAHLSCGIWERIDVLLYYLENFCFPPPPSTVAF